jgi:hypothetical protein
MRVQGEYGYDLDRLQRLRTDALSPTMVSVPAHLS